MEKTEFEREREKFIESHKEELCTIYSELCQMRDYSLRNDLENFRRHQAEFSKLEQRVFVTNDEDFIDSKQSTTSLALFLVGIITDIV